LICEDGGDRGSFVGTMMAAAGAPLQGRRWPGLLYEADGDRRLVACMVGAVFGSI
jgi:hypothetical protein